MKRLILPVTCVNSDANDVPNTCLVCLTDAGLKRIEELAALVCKVSAYEISEFFYSATWSGYLIETEPSIQELKQIVRAIKRVAYRVDVPQICVTSDSICFTSVPKHCGDELGLRTRRVYISDLMSSDLIVAV